MGALDGRTVAVTGAGRGIGRAVALLAAEEGASVVVTDNGCEPDGTGGSHDFADATAEAITTAGGKAVATYGDVASWEGGEETIKAALDTYGTIDALVNCAGIVRDTPIWEMTEEERLAWGEEDLLYRPSGSEGDEGQQAPIAYRAIPAAKHYFALIGRVELRASALVGEWESKARLKMLLRAFPLEDIARF